MRLLPFCSQVLFVVALVSLALLARTADATLVVFPNNGWTAGSPAPGQTLNQNFTSGGQNITVSVNNNGNSSSGASWQNNYPAFNSTQTTGGFSGQVGLQLFASTTSSTSAYVLTTVSFASPVTNVSFQIWDVDKSAGQFIDTISAIQALSSTGVVQAASSVTSAVAGYNTITGSGLGISIAGTNGASNTTNQGTINISFSGPITQFSFRWGNGDSGLGQQAIGLGNINFTAVPEKDALWPIVGLLTGLAVMRTRRKLNGA